MHRYKDDRVAVVGGGNTALENILPLTEYAKEVKAVIVTDDFTGNPDLRERITKLPKVKISLVALIWLVPDRRIESALGGEDT